GASNFRRFWKRGTPRARRANIKSFVFLGSPMVRLNFRTLSLAGILAILFSGAQTSRCQTAPSREQLEGLPNFGRVTNMLYRGGQPDLEGFTALQKMGVTIIVNLRDEPSEMAAEERLVESRGIKYLSIPWSGRKEPTNAQVLQFLDLIHANPQARIFVHC